MDIKNDDVIDSRDIQAELDSLDENDDAENLKMLNDIKEETESMGFEFGIQFIRESYFQDYAQELAEDCGMIPANNKWPCTCIDWDHASRELAYDYSMISFGGDDWYYREA